MWTADRAAFSEPVTFPWLCRFTLKFLVFRVSALERLAWGLGWASSPVPAGPFYVFFREMSEFFAHFKIRWLGFFVVSGVLYILEINPQLDG